MDTEAGDDLDRQDMARLREGRDAALNDLMERHAPRLFHYLIRKLGDETEAEDVAQESFVRVFQHRERYDPRHRFSTWLYTIATNLARDRHRHRLRHPQVSLEAENERTGTDLKHTLPDGTEDPAASAVADERAAAVRNAIARLPEEMRTPLLLAEYEDRSLKEIASMLNCTAKAVEMRLYRARQELRQSLAGWL